MVSLKTIEEFVSSKRIAFVGASTNKQKSGYQFFKDLTNKGFNLIPINPRYEEIDGKKCYPSLTSAKDQIDAVLIVTPKSSTKQIVEECVQLGMKKVWIQLMSDTPEAIEIAKSNGIDVIAKKCIMMFAAPNGIHKFHRFFVKLFGRYPR